MRDREGCRFDGETRVVARTIVPPWLIVLPDVQPNTSVLYRSCVGQEVEMLVVTRKVGQGVRIGDDITVVVASTDSGQVRIAISAPQELRIARIDRADPGGIPGS